MMTERMIAAAPRYPEPGCMTATVVIGNATLYQGDCLEILPTLSGIDAVVTDPPYGIGEKMRGGTWGSANKYEDFRQWDKQPPEEVLRRLFVSQMPSIVWGGNYFEAPPSRCWLVWDKLNAVPTMADTELAWTNFDRPAKRLRLPVGRHEWGHPTEKPLRLMTWCLSFLPDAQTILDPFMGSGTTGVAAVQMNRKFIGIELEPRYFDIACERIEKASAQGRLFDDEPEEAPEQSTLDLSGQMLDQDSAA